VRDFLQGGVEKLGGRGTTLSFTLIIPHLLLPSPYPHEPVSPHTHTRHKLLGRKLRMHSEDELNVAGWRL